MGPPPFRASCAASGPGGAGVGSTPLALSPRATPRTRLPEGPPPARPRLQMHAPRWRLLATLDTATRGRTHASTPGASIPVEHDMEVLNLMIKQERTSSPPRPPVLASYLGLVWIEGVLIQHHHICQPLHTTPKFEAISVPHNSEISPADCPLPTNSLLRVQPKLVYIYEGTEGLGCCSGCHYLHRRCSPSAATPPSPPVLQPLQPPQPVSPALQLLLPPPPAPPALLALLLRP